jgi:hypothetical protein
VGQERHEITSQSYERVVMGFNDAKKTIGISRDLKSILVQIIHACPFC